MKYKKMRALPEKIILDLCGGTTAIVAEKLGRKWIGIEINAKYLEVAEERIKKAHE